MKAKRTIAGAYKSRLGALRRWKQLERGSIIRRKVRGRVRWIVIKTS